ncbi:MAG: hypothetical protein ACRDZX_17755 [Acidimicrobiales bacterium]
MAAWHEAGQVLARSGRRLGNGAPHWWQLVGLCVGLNLTETTLVAAFAPSSYPYLAPQASAVFPFGVFGDLRWVSVYHDSWPSLAAELVGVLFVRGALTALSIALAWPSLIARPSAATLLRRGAFAAALASVLLWPSVALLFGLAVAPVSWLFLAAVPTALLVAFVVHPAAVSADWWRRVVAPRAIGWLALAFVTMSLSSAVIAALPLAAWPVVAALSGLFNAWSWVGLVHAVVDRRPVRHLVPVAAMTTTVLVGIVVGGAVIGFSLAHRTPRAVASSSSSGTYPGAQAAVLVVSGYGSNWDGAAVHPFRGDFTEERFSYRGLAPSGQPLPYTSTDTAKPLLELDRMLLAQVASLNRRTGEPVNVVAESEGALIAKTALLAEPSPAVATLVMASPLEDPGRVWYPTQGDQGWGVASNEAMRLISDAFQGVAPIDLSPESPLFASLDRQAPVLETAMSCRIYGIRQFALLPLADATVTPATEQLSFPSVVLPAFHGGLLETSAGRKIVSQVLDDRRVSQDRLMVLAEKAISYAASAWQVPSLAASDYPKQPARSDRCGAVAAEFHAALLRSR